MYRIETEYLSEDSAQHVIERQRFHNM
jgi:hypothetical protein